MTHDENGTGPARVSVTIVLDFLLLQPFGSLVPSDFSIPQVFISGFLSDVAGYLKMKSFNILALEGVASTFPLFPFRAGACCRWYRSSGHLHRKRSTQSSAG